MLPHGCPPILEETHSVRIMKSCEQRKENLGMSVVVAATIELSEKVYAVMNVEFEKQNVSPRTKHRT